MSNPLTEEQIKKINEIAKLSAEQQQKAFSEFLPTLTDEQVEFLKNQQGKSQCLFCSLSEGSINSYKVYEDDQLLGVLDINPVNPGHTILFPKKHFQFLGELNDEMNGHMFNIANKISSKIVGKACGFTRCHIFLKAIFCFLSFLADFDLLIGPILRS